MYSQARTHGQRDAAPYADKLLDADSRKLAFTPKDAIADPDTDYGSIRSAKPHGSIAEKP